jgi:hypothetical protein
MAPANMPRRNTSTNASANDDIDAAANIDPPAPNIERVNARSLGSRFWSTDTRSTPTATPKPSAVTKMPNPAGPAWSTFSAKIEPRGTIMPPPMRPVARPRFTARTTGVRKMNCQPSRSSWYVAAQSMRRSLFASPSVFRSGLGRRNDQITAAERRNVRIRTTNASVSWSVCRKSIAPMSPIH